MRESLILGAVKKCSKKKMQGSVHWKGGGFGQIGRSLAHQF